MLQAKIVPNPVNFIKSRTAKQKIVAGVTKNHVCTGMADDAITGIVLKVGVAKQEKFAFSVLFLVSIEN